MASVEKEGPALKAGIHAPEVELDKVSGNKTLKLFAVDSLGNEYPITKISKQQRPGKLATRQVSGEPLVLQNGASISLIRMWRNR